MSKGAKEFISLSFMLFIIFIGLFFFMKESCSQKAISFEEHRFGIFQGCMVKHNNKWLPLENIRGFDDK